MSVISTYTARVTISVFITIIALLENTSNGQSHDKNFFYYGHRERISSDSSRDDGGSSLYPKDHVPDIEDTSQSDAKEIPLEFFKQLNNVTDMDEFIRKFVDENDPELKNFGSNMFERSAGQLAKAANCEPTLQVVPLEPYGSPSTDPAVVFLPKCTRIRQCSGCCNSHALVCTPIETQEISLTVNKFKYRSSGFLKFLGKDPVSVQEHIKCECQCKVKQEHCNAYQRYDSSHCECVCKNNDEKDKCQSEGGKIWDHTRCTCGCRKEVPCTTGSFFNTQTCKCEEENNDTPKFGNLDRKRFIIKATPVVQDNSTLYDTTDN